MAGTLSDWEATKKPSAEDKRLLKASLAAAQAKQALLQTKLATQNRLLKENQIKINEYRALVKTWSPYSGEPHTNPKWITWNEYNDKLTYLIRVRDDRLQSIANLTQQLQETQKAARVTTAAAKTAGAIVPSDASAPTVDLPNGRVGKIVHYNLSSADESYFRTDETLLQKSNQYFANKPKKIDYANQLWRDNGGHKGMIQTWRQPKAFTNTTVQESSTQGDMSKVQTHMDLTRYGFQFLYNPGSIMMEYKGTPDIDMSLYTSGIEKFNPSGPAMSQSTIKFDLLINRTNDFRYIDPKSSTFKRAGVNYGDVYSNRQPIIDTKTKVNELKDIYNKGTMYDVEYLLKTLLGYQLRSQLRNEITSDMGWVSPKPVELHLGAGMRYLVFIGGFTINHVIFNERMVPLFSTLSLTCNRIPDYDGGNYKSK